MNHVSSMSKGKERSSDGALGDISGSSAKALQRALAALQGEKGMSLTDKSSKKGKKSKIVEDDYDDDDDDNPFHAMLEGGDGNQRKRRRAPEMDEDIDDTGVDLVEDFGRKKKEFLAKKKEHYKAEPRYGGFDETVEDGHKRAASYEIMKNKGLTPHRKKANRNPRVKKREAYDKAIIRRKGQVRDVVQGQAGAYSGELTGIKAGISRSRRM